MIWLCPIVKISAPPPLYWSLADSTCRFNFILWLTDFGTKIQWAFKRGPPLHYFYGAFESDISRASRISPLKSKLSTHTKQSQKLRVAIPTKVTTSTSKRGEKDETETTEQYVEQIFEIIYKEYKNNKKQPVCYYGLVTNPKSFSATVKSMFYLSFLVKGTLRMLRIGIFFSCILNTILSLQLP